MSDIKQIAVIGSGVMGMGIAALAANAGYDVLLLDIVPKDASDRNMLAKGAIDKALKAKIPAFTHKRNAKRVTPGNLEDDLKKLGECDWIIEVVLERLDIKHDVYKKIDAVRKKGSIVSSNTSTIPLEKLTDGMSDSFKQDFLITHFFNPPRFMRLLEIITGPATKKDVKERIEAFAEVNLGKGLVQCKDTPGFIANRIGVYWLMVALYDAIEMGISVEDADAVMSRPIGVPKTGVFGLFDLIGIDLMPLIAKAMLDTLPANDVFRTIYHEPELVTKMIADGYTGRKGKGGFYRLGENRTKEAVNLSTGEYAPAKKSKLSSVGAAKGGLRALIEHEDIGGKYARRVLTKFLHYTASLVPEISDEITSIDDAMRYGYSWKYGPFELIDKLGTKDESGTAYFAKLCEEFGLSVPPIIAAANGKPFYQVEGANKEFLDGKGIYHKIAVPKDAWSLEDIKRNSKPVKKTGSASLWDVGDGVLCLEFTSKMNSIDPDILSLLEECTNIVPQNHRALMIGGDGDNFSVGANLGFFLYACNVAAFGMMSDAIRQGHRTMMALKYAPFPVVGAVHGMALGGGCELTLHCDAAQAHIETYTGLVEVGVGVIPGWGGCKEMLVRHMAKERRGFGGSMPKLRNLFEIIGMAKVSGSAHEAQDMLILNDKSRISMSRARLLNDAKNLALDLSKNYAAPEPAEVHLPGPAAKLALMLAIKGMAALGKVSAHDTRIMEALGTVLTGDKADIKKPVSEQDLLDLEHDMFMSLIQTKPTLDRIEHMLETGKPLRN